MPRTIREVSYKYSFFNNISFMYNCWYNVHTIKIIKPKKFWSTHRHFLLPLEKLNICISRDGERRA